MPERTLPMELNGTEVIEAVTDAIRRRMRQDCFLNPDTAYSWFRAEISYKVTMNDCGRLPEVEQKVIVEGGTKPEGGEESIHLSQVTGEIKINEAPPNQARQESGQPIPTARQTGDGRTEIKGVSYRRPR